MINDQNASQRFMFQQGHVRGQIVRLEHTAQTILSQRPYPPMIRYLLGETLIASLLLAGSLKQETDLSLQFQGDARLPLLLVQCDHELNLLACTKFKSDLPLEDYASAFLTGKMVITLTPHHHTQAYQSIIPIQSTDMSENLTHYFAQSEQLTTHIWLASDEQRFAGMMLQLLPSQGEDSQERELFWEYATQLGQTVTNEELLNLDNETLLYRLYNETELMLFESRSARFRCRCSEEKMKQAVKMLGEEDAKALIQEKGMVEIHCEFCNKHFCFDAIDITVLFKT